ncbi:hypothetical protein [Actinophytocola sp.]|uniref:hypothetical protein n=1 Tax=Actinophytocola sp. TaxID=1872138 RepID=UPI003899C1E5
MVVVGGIVDRVAVAGGVVLVARGVVVGVAVAVAAAESTAGTEAAETSTPLVTMASPAPETTATPRRRR